MRYYDYDYVKELKASLNKIYDSVDPTYTNSFNNLSSEDSVVTKLKNDCIGTAHSAENRITVLRKRYIRLVSILTKFYSDVDISASETYKMALDVWDSIKGINDTVSGISSLITKTGDYDGIKVNPKDITAAASNMPTVTSKQISYWEKYFLNDDGSLNEAALTKYFDDTDKMLASGQTNVIATLALGKVLDDYLKEHNYSEEAYTYLINALINSGTKLADILYTSSYDYSNLDYEYNPATGEYGRTYRIIYQFKDSFNYLIKTCTDCIGMAYQLGLYDYEGGDKDIKNRLSLYDTMYALSSTGYITFSNFLVLGEYAEMNPFDESSEEFRNRIAQYFSSSFVITKTPEGDICVSYSAHDGFVTGYAFPIKGGLLGNAAENKDIIDKIVVHSWTNNMEQVFDNIEGERAQQLYNLALPDALGLQAADFLMFTCLPALLPEIGAGFTVADLGLSAYKDYTTWVAANRLSMAYGTADEREAFSENTDPRGSYWEVYKGDQLQYTGGSSIFFYKPSEAQISLCYKYYVGSTSTILPYGSEEAKAEFKKHVEPGDTLIKKEFRQ